VWLQWGDPLLGLVNGYCALTLGVVVELLIMSIRHADAPDMYNSPFFEDSPSGVGGWGDPKNDYQINTGGFKDVIRAYPSPHHIRRNYTLYPFRNQGAGRLFPNDPLAPPPPRDLMINSSMTKVNYEHTVNSFEGDFIGLHSYTESLSVSRFCEASHLMVLNGLYRAFILAPISFLEREL
jgi:hypothetical protein